MAFLIDTSILVRLTNAADAQHSVAAHAVLELHRRGEVLHITPQVLIKCFVTPKLSGSRTRQSAGNPRSGERGYMNQHPTF